MRLRQYLRRVRQSLKRDRRPRPPRRFDRPLEVEALEGRTLLSCLPAPQRSLCWVNRGLESDGFNPVFGANAPLARAVVDAAITSWERVIIGFNQRFGGNRIDVTVVMGTNPGTGGGVGISAVDVGGSPTAGTIVLGPGYDGHGRGWFLDPTPLESGEFQGAPGNAFAGYALPGSPAYGLEDFLSVATRLLGSVLGYTYDTRLRLQTGGLAVNTGVPDRSAGGGLGFYYAFTAPGCNALLTSYNAGGAFPGPVNSAQPGDPAYPIHFRGQPYYGADDVMNPWYTISQRHLVSNNAVCVLARAYNYTVASLDTLDTFYAVLNQATGHLVVRGPQGCSNDWIGINVQAGNLAVNVTVGSPVPGAGHAVTLRSTFPLGSIRSIRVETGDCDDTVWVDRLGTGMPMSIDTGAGNDGIHLSDAARDLGGIQSGITVTGGSDVDHLGLYDDRLTAGAFTYTITNTGVTVAGLPNFGVTYTASVESLRLVASRAADTRVDVSSTAAGTSVTVQGASWVRVGNAGSVQGILGTLTVENPTRTTDLLVDDTADPVARTVTLSASGITGLAPAAINFVPRALRALAIWGGSGGNIFTVTDTPLRPTTGLYAGTGNDTVNVQRTTGDLTLNGRNGLDTVNVGNAGSVQQIAGTLTVADALGSTVLSVDNRADPLSRTVQLDHQTLTGLAPATIDYRGANLRALMIWGGSGGDTVTVTNTPSSSSLLTSTSVIGGSGNDTVTVQATTGLLSLDGGGGSNTLVGPAALADWSITGLDTGNLVSFPLAGPVSFQQFGNLTDGWGVGLFIFSNGMGCSGTVDGGVGGWLDYTAYLTGITVNLPLGQATGVAGGILNIQNVIGGAADDILVGDAQRNILYGGPGRDLLIAGGLDWSTFMYSFLPDTLYGGTPLTPGGDEDILIGGWTIYDTTPGLLAAILAAWTGPAPYATRVDDFLAPPAGSGIPLLDATTVFYNHGAGGNTLMGGGPNDLFFGDPTLDTYDAVLAPPPPLIPDVFVQIF